jgi:ABC-type Fe3+-hydroxamate transport system substrate-binding protein
VRRRAHIITLAATALVATACGSRQEPVASVPAEIVTVPDGAGGVARVRPTDGPTVTTDVGAASTLQALGVPYELVTVDRLAQRLRTSPLPRLAVLAPGVEAAPGVPVLRWSIGDPGVAGTMMARLALATGKGAEGVQLAHTVDAGVKGALRQAGGQPVTKVLVEGSRVQQLAALVQELHATPVPYSGVAGVQRANPTAWLVTPGTPRTLGSLRATPELRRVPAVQERRFRVVDPTLFTPSPELPSRLAELVGLLHPGAAA